MEDLRNPLAEVGIADMTRTDLELLVILETKRYDKRNTKGSISVSGIPLLVAQNALIIQMLKDAGTRQVRYMRNEEDA